MKMEKLKKDLKSCRQFVLVLLLVFGINIMSTGEARGAELPESVMVKISDSPTTHLKFDLYDDGTAVLINYSSNGGIAYVEIPQTVVSGTTGRVHTVTAIEKAGFGAKLEGIEIPVTVTKIGEYAFSGCSSLTSLTLPENVSEVGRDAFRYCENLELIYYPADKEIDVENAGIPDSTVQISYSEKEDESISLTIESVPEGEETEYTIPEEVGGHSVSSVAVGQGVDSSKLELICNKHKPKIWNRDADRHWIGECSLCGRSDTVKKDNHSYGDGKTPCICGYVPFTITSNTANPGSENGNSGGTRLSIAVKKTLGTENITYQWYENNKAVSGAASAVYTVPADKKAGEYKYFCKVSCGGYCIDSENLLVTIVRETYNNIHKKGDLIQDKNKKGIYKVVTAGNLSGKTGTVTYMKPAKKSAKTVTVPATITVDGIRYKVTGIAKNAFKNNRKITKITIGNNVKTVGSSAFYGCTKLKTVTLGKNITTIDARAFFKCTALTRITIPDKVTRIGKQAFYGCKKLKSITIKTTKLTSKRVGKYAFKGIYQKATVKVPKSKFNTYKKLLKNRGVSKNVKIKK